MEGNTVTCFYNRDARHKQDRPATQWDISSEEASWEVMRERIIYHINKLRKADGVAPAAELTVKTIIGITLAKDYDRPVGYYVDADGNVSDAYTLYFRIYRCMLDCGFFVLIVKTSQETTEQLRAKDPYMFVV